MNQFVTRYVWLDPQGKIVDRISEYDRRTESGEQPCVVLAGEQPYVDKIVSFLLNKEEK